MRTKFKYNIYSIADNKAFRYPKTVNAYMKFNISSHFFHSNSA